MISHFEHFFKFGEQSFHKKRNRLNNMIIRTSECIPCTFWFNFNLNKNFSSFVEFHMQINFSLIKLNSLRKIKSQFKENRQKMFLKKSFILSCTNKYKKKKHLEMFGFDLNTFNIPIQFYLLWAIGLNSKLKLSCL